MAQDFWGGMAEGIQAGSQLAAQAESIKSRKMQNWQAQRDIEYQMKRQAILNPPKIETDVPVAGSESAGSGDQSWSTKFSNAVSSWGKSLFGSSGPEAAPATGLPGGALAGSGTVTTTPLPPASGVPTQNYNAGLPGTGGALQTFGTGGALQALTGGGGAGGAPAPAIQPGGAPGQPETPAATNASEARMIGLMQTMQPGSTLGQRLNDPAMWEKMYQLEAEYKGPEAADKLMHDRLDRMRAGAVQNLSFAAALIDQDPASASAYAVKALSEGMPGVSAVQGPDGSMQVKTAAGTFHVPATKDGLMGLAATFMSPEMGLQYAQFAFTKQDKLADNVRADKTLALQGGQLALARSGQDLERQRLDETKAQNEITNANDTRRLDLEERRIDQAGRPKPWDAGDQLKFRTGFDEALNAGMDGMSPAGKKMALGVGSEVAQYFVQAGKADPNGAARLVTQALSDDAAGRLNLLNMVQPGPDGQLYMSDLNGGAMPLTPTLRRLYLGEKAKEEQVRGRGAPAVPSQPGAGMLNSATPMGGR